MTAETKHPSHSDPIHQSIEHMSAYFDSIKAEVSINRFPQDFFLDTDRWQIKIELGDTKSGIALKAATTGSTLFDAMFDAYQKVRSIEEVGVPDEVFGRTALPPPRPDEERMTAELDDEIPL